MVVEVLWICALVVASHCLPLERDQIKLREGQPCGEPAVGQCDTNLTCVVVETSTKNDTSISAGVCSTALAPGCVPCSAVQCPPARKVCPGGHVTDPCGCCPHCARQHGQVCGGASWSHGYCDRDLTCTQLTGFLSAMPPLLGVCKVLPGQRSDPLADPLCPWVQGCNVRAGGCDCYSLQTCQAAFSYRILQDCLKTLRGDEEDWLAMREREDDDDEEEEDEECVEWGCEVHGKQCICQERTCNSNMPLLSEDSCHSLLALEGCSNVTCPEAPTPRCPADSFLSEPYTPPGQCCPLVAATCTCLLERCPLEPPSCPPKHHVKLTARGDGHPGSCCNHYLCEQEVADSHERLS